MRTGSPGCAPRTMMRRGTSIRSSAGLTSMEKLGMAFYFLSWVTIMAVVRSLLMGVTFRPFLAAQMFW